MSINDEFSIEKAMRIVMRHKKPKSPPTIDVENIIITEELLEHCLIKMAKIVAQDDVYLPIFKKVKQELELFKVNKELKDYARQIANNQTNI